MRGKILNSVCAVLTAAACTVPAFAAPVSAEDAVQAIISADETGKITASGSGIAVNGASDSEVRKALNEVFRSEDIGSVIEPGEKLSYISKEDIEQLAYQDDYVKTWCSENVPNIVPSGLSLGEAENRVYEYLDAIPYANEEANDTGKTLDMQSAYSIFTYNKGICASYSHLFRAMMEAIPFNAETGLTDWAAGNDHVEVALVSYISDENSGHQWAAVKTPEWADTPIDWQYFDLIYDSEGNSLSKQQVEARLMKMFPVIDNEVYSFKYQTLENLSLEWLY